MAKNTYRDLSVTPANNTDLLSANATGSADANTIDTLIQNLAGMTARFYGDIGGRGSVGGSGNTITLTSLSTYQMLETGIIVAIKASASNTGAATLNLDANGAKAIRKAGDVPLVAGELAANGKYLLIYDEAYNSGAGAWVLLNPSIPTDTYQPYDADLVDVAAVGVSAFSGLLYGLTLSNNASDATNDIDVAAGVAIDATNAKFLKLAAGLTKRLDAAWTVGTNQGGLDTGEIANGWYHAFLIMRSDTGVVDVLFSTSISSPTMPTNYDFKRYIGSFHRNSGAIRPFSQVGDTFYWGAPISDVDDTDPGTSVLTKTVTTPPGIVTEAMVTVQLTHTSAANDYGILLSSTDQTDVNPGTSITSGTFHALAPATNGSAREVAGPIRVKTNTSSQIRYRAGASTGSFRVMLKTAGYINRRGRL